MSNEKLIRKVLRTLPKKFAHKVTAIEEAQYLSTMGFDELIGNLTTFKMMFEAMEPSRGKGVALQVSNLDNGEENLAEIVNMLAKNFNKTLKRFNKKPYSRGSTIGNFDQWTDKGWKNSKYGGSNSSGNTQSRSKGIKCRECEGFGHIQIECPNYVKKQSKSYYTTLSDEETEEEEESDNKASNFVVFTVRDTKEMVVNPSVNECTTDNMSDEEGDLTEEELMVNYQLLFMKWLKLTQAYTSGEVERVSMLKKNEDLMQCVERKNLKICILEDKIQGMIKGIKMMNSSTIIWDEILLQGKRCGDNMGVGFNGGKMTK
ncbi:hypothetical protein LIER_26902 [Lithospermum erythrorhizon]|uniref:Gag-pol polyprotein n=1 Tax=Lithospermum erythrorhizon TaxID=34254 RepID=A0AAV3RC43_LITER